MKSLAKNRKGIYEYILTKSVMLVFILGLVGIFVSFYQNMSIKSADDIANSEATRIAKQIDDAIGFKGVSNTITVYLDDELKVGKEVVPYTFEINSNGVAVVRFVQYPYEGIYGFAQFGLKMQRIGGLDKVSCTWYQISNGASFQVIKESSNYYKNNGPIEDQGLYYVVKVTIDASADCNAQMVFQEEFKESS